MNTEDETTEPLWLREFNNGLADGWKEDDRLLYAKCANCERAVWRSSNNGDIAWIHYNPPQFHKPEYPRPCFTPEPKHSTVIGHIKELPKEPEGAFQKKAEKQHGSAAMVLFMLSEEDRFLFGEMVEALKKHMTPGQRSLCQRMLISLKSNHRVNEDVEDAALVGLLEADCDNCAGIRIEYTNDDTTARQTIEAQLLLPNSNANAPLQKDQYIGAAKRMLEEQMGEGGRFEVTVMQKKGKR